MTRQSGTISVYNFVFPIVSSSSNCSLISLKSFSMLQCDTKYLQGCSLLKSFLVPFARVKYQVPGTQYICHLHKRENANTVDIFIMFCCLMKVFLKVYCLLSQLLLIKGISPIEHKKKFYSFHPNAGQFSVPLKPTVCIKISFLCNNLLKQSYKAQGIHLN